MFNHKADLKGGKALSRDALKVSVKLELFKRRYGLFSKSMGNAYIPFTGLQGVLSYEGTSDMIYKGEAVHIHYRLELKRYLDKKLTIKQHFIEKKYQVFDIKKSEELPSNLYPPEPQQQRSEPVAQAPRPKAEPTEELKAQPVKVAPKKPVEEDMEEEPPKAAPSSGLSHPLAGDIKVMNKTDLVAYMGQLKTAKPAIEKQGMDIKELLDFEKTSFSVKFLTIYLEQLEKQQESLINGKTVDSETLKKCSDLLLDLTKRKGQVERSIQSGKLTPAEYKDCIQNEFDGLLSQAKFVKKFVKNTSVFKFMYAKAQIMDSEIKELEEFLKSA